VALSSGWARKAGPEGPPSDRIESGAARSTNRTVFGGSPIGMWACSAGPRIETDPDGLDRLPESRSGAGVTVIHRGVPGHRPDRG